MFVIAASGASLALWVVASCLWARSHFAGDRLIWLKPSGLRWVESSGGYLAAADVPGITADPGGWEWERGHANPDSNVWAPLAFSVEYQVTGEIRVLGLQRIEGVQSYPARRQRPDGTTHVDVVDYPFRLANIRWRSVVLLTGLLPAAVFGPGLVRRAGGLVRRRRRTGECPRCGYDLRATPGRCPECGAISNG